MFSGIVESQAKVLGLKPRGPVFELTVTRPESFDDIRVGDSISINGVCLTVESFDENQMTFALGPETLKVTGWCSDNPLDSDVNCERSLKFGDRVHGHLVTGHVDGLAEVIRLEDLGESVVFQVEFPRVISPLVWKKGSLTLNGVSLTINEVDGQRASLCLIPETLQRTNLRKMRVGTRLTLEADNLARGLLRQKEVQVEHNT